MDAALSGLLSFPVWLALILVFALPALEASVFLGVVVPGETALILGGVLAAGDRLPLAAVLALGILGAIVGDSVGYAVGRRWGRRILDSSLGRFVRAEHFDRAQVYLAARGGRAVLLGRFTALLRALIPGLAGMSDVRYLRTFLPWNITGGALWGAGAVLLGYAAGASWQKAAHEASWFGFAVLALIVLAAVGGAVVHRRRERRHPPP
jgi:undecaprenyl-diphosphatase